MKLVGELHMPKTMKAIQERLTRLEGLMGWIPKNEDRSFHDRVELAMDIVEKLLVSMSNSWQKHVSMAPGKLSRKSYLF